MLGSLRFVIFGYLLLFALSVCACSLSLDDLTLYLPFDDSADAAFARGIGAQQSKDVVYDFEKGIVGNAIVAGDSGKPLVSYSVASNLDQDNGSIAFWYKPVDWSAGDGKNHVLFDIPDRVEFYHKAGFGTFFDWLGAPQTNMVGWGVGGLDLVNLPSKQGIWRHVVVTWNDKGIGTLYLDGKKSFDTDNVPKGNAPKWAEGKLFRLADFSRSNGGNNKILFDEVMVFNRAIRESEAAALFRRTVMTDAKTKLRIGFLEKAPSFSGKAEDWTQTAQIAGFSDTVFGFLTEKDVRFNIAYDKQNLYIRLIDYTGKNTGNAEILIAGSAASSIQTLSMDFQSKLTGSLAAKSTGKATFNKTARECIFEYKIPLASIPGDDISSLCVNAVRKWSDSYGDSAVLCPSKGGDYRDDVPSYVLVEFGGTKPVTSVATLGQPYYCKYIFKANIIDPLASNSKVSIKTSLQPGNLSEFYDPETIFGTRSLTGEQIPLGKDVQTDTKSTFVYIEQSFTNLDIDSLNIEVTDSAGDVIYKTARNYVPNPPILLTPVPYPAKNKLQAVADISGYFGNKDGVFAEISFIGSDKKIAYTQNIQKFTEDKAEFSLPLDKLPDGKITIRSKIKRLNTEIASIDSSFNKLGDGPWIGSQLGYSDELLPGFTPMTVKGQSVGMYNREYIWHNSLFPVQIISNGKELLHSPIEFSTGEKTLKSNPATIRLLESDDQHVILECKGEVDGVPVTVKHTLEYDGMCWSEVVFSPKQEVTFDKMTLFIVYNRDESTLFQSHYAGVGQVRGKGDVEGQYLDGNADLYSRPNFWFGNEEEGLTWFCEDWANWVLAKNPKPHKVRCDDVSTTFATEFSNVPVTFNKPYKLEFGIIATPVKPMPKNWRTWQCWRDFSFAWVGAFTPGNNEIATPNASFKEWTKTRHNWGQMFTVPYQRPDWTNVNVPEYEYFSTDWTTLPKRYHGGDSDPKFRYVPVCLNSTWVDYMLYYAVKAFDELEMDGFYFDGAIPEYNGCQNMEHGCGWINENGYLRQSFPIRAYREFYKRLKVEFNKRGRPSWIYAHASSSVQLPTLSFVDLILGGEEFSIKAPKERFYSKIMTNDYIRAIYIGDQYGIPMQLINEIGLDGSSPTDEETDDYLALLIPHGIGDIAYWNGGGNFAKSYDYSRGILMNQMWFGIREADCEFIPYWKNDGSYSISPANDRIKCSIYKRPGKVFVVVGNTTPDRQKVTITLDKAKLGLPETLNIKPVNPEPITEEDGVLTFEINGSQMGKNWQMIYINQE